MVTSGSQQFRCARKLVQLPAIFPARGHWSARHFAMEPNGSSSQSSLRPQLRSSRLCCLLGCRWKALPWSCCASSRASITAS